jgi:hypothetical protein
MALTGNQIGQMREALLAGFPSKGSLEMMVRIHLDQSLDVIVEADNQTERIYNLVTWAERSGQVGGLIAGAFAEHPMSSQIARLAADSQTWALDAPAPPAPQPEIRPYNAGPAVHEALDDIQAAYLDYLYTRYQYLDFKGMGVSDQVPLRLLFCLVAEDIELLPRSLFTRLIDRGRQNPAAFGRQLRQLYPWSFLRRSLLAYTSWTIRHS